ncbi:putative Nucleoside 2-deoxyribosyltransferase like-containing protein [Homarus americanus]|uniref:Putative Nucleoside 2-deoxyribosyltransferase like-containing protein n=1 Tax=Homarus americanus TaxID=6706 RepID=A0A8J5MZV5_HOMAM|nr:putative Nucleoside 2-deoxyribosyltransferase like-containing protein [Homarus americanus]
MPRTPTTSVISRLQYPVILAHTWATGSWYVAPALHFQLRCSTSPRLLPGQCPVLYPLCTCMHEMLHVARECSAREAAGHLLTFGEFCLFTNELRQCYDRESPRPVPLSKLSDKSCVDKKRSERKMSTESSPKYEVFLGGSCNPTTWRQNVAIPMLKDQGISFYNPQVSHWEEALVELEYQAKQTASVLFFVLDRNTRNVASMVEAAYMAGCRRKLVVVMDSYSGPGQLINGEAISELEYQDLTNGLHTVQDLVERQGIPVFGEINHALNCTAKILRENLRPQDLGLEDHVQPIKYPYLQLGDKLIKLHDAFVNTNSEQITLAEARVAFKVVTNKDLTTEVLQAIVAAKKGIEMQELNGVELPLNEVFLTFDEFCCIVAEFKNQHLESKRLWDVFTHSVQKVLGWALPRRPLRPINSTGGRDIYLGGSIGNRVSWRDDIAIPMLRKHGLSYFNPAAGACSGRLLPMEAALMEHSRVLFFVITDTTRGVSAMTLASHYIGLGCNVVLCVQMITEGSLVNGETLSRLALKDYNRGRSYLTDQANKDGIPVFVNIQEGIECAISKCRAR